MFAVIVLTAVAMFVTAWTLALMAAAVYLEIITRHYYSAAFIALVIISILTLLAIIAEK